MTSYQGQYPCPPGTFTGWTNLTSSGQCTDCPERYACAAGTGVSINPKVSCAIGHYCPARTASPVDNACPAGTFGPRTNLASADECTRCTAGYYCSGGSGTVSGPCMAGYYCPNGTVTPNQYPCPAGTYGSSTDLWLVSQCTVCPKGHYCPLASPAPIDCPAGSYADDYGFSVGVPGSAKPSCIICPAGHYCPKGSVTPINCGVGQFSDAGAIDCSLCSAGYFCNNNSTSRAMMEARPCEAGTYCPPGTTHHSDFFNDPCPKGYYCPAATPVPIGCPTGTYNPELGRAHPSECQSCPAGSYCTYAAPNVTGPCDPGYYCPNGSSGPRQFPCPPATYNPLYGAESVEACRVCPAGYYCLSGTAVPADCPRGYYCISGVAKPEPCPLGTYGNATGMRVDEDCVDCPAGHYCDGLGLSVPTGECDPGFYCRGRAYTSAPPEGATGGLCPRGGYCPVGSAFPTACEAGTYNNYTGGRSQVDCWPCDPGYYCAGSSNPWPTGPCDPGYYCTGGAGTRTQYAAPQGTYTLSGASAPVPCAAGTYNPMEQQSSCLICDAGFYCPNQSTIWLKDCPLGSYCPNGTYSPPFCPPGTYGAALRLRSVDECTTCPMGQYCQNQGMTAPSGPCSPGFFCTGGAILPTPPLAASYGGPCPLGHWCPEGTSVPSPCPAGQYLPTMRESASDACLDCPPGFACNQSGLGAPSSSCSAGYYCTGKTINPTPIGVHGDICPVGTYCPEGSAHPIGCSPGTYQNLTGQSACLPCPAGFFCLGNDTMPGICPPGKYCPEGTTGAQKNCPSGTYSNAVGLSSEAQCTRCEPSYYCYEAGSTTPSGQCAAGYYCRYACSTQFGTGTHPEHVGGDCPKGAYCPAAISDPVLCPAGTYSANDRNTEESNCLSCTAGKYCAGLGLSAVSGSCSAGYFCTGGATAAKPPNDHTGGECPIGSFCVEGSPNATACPAGTYASTVRSSSCTQCPAAYYCPVGTGNYVPNICPAGYFCPDGTKAPFTNPCPAGTYSSTQGLTAQSACTECPPGKYCSGLAQTVITGDCASGYYCAGSAVVAAPATLSQGGGICVEGQFCPPGSSSPTSCTPGQYCGAQGLSAPSGDCAAGFYCRVGATTDKPPVGATGGPCEPGYYCPVKSADHIACPSGTYSTTAQNVLESACLDCQAGSYCVGQGRSAVSGSCTAGYYCPAGSTTPTHTPCPIGNKCPAGSPSPTLCASGTYQNQTAQAICLPCPAGYYCLSSFPDTPKPCPRGYYCLCDAWPSRARAFPALSLFVFLAAGPEALQPHTAPERVVGGEGRSGAKVRMSFSIRARMTACLPIYGGPCCYTRWSFL